MTSFDALIIGAGQAGPSLAGRFNDASMTVAIIVVTRIAPILGTLFLGKAPTPAGRRLAGARAIVAQAQG